MLIDFHTHAFADKIAAKTVKLLQKNSGGLPPVFDGTVSGLLSAMDQYGVDASVVLNIATKPGQHQKILEHCLSFASDRLIPFASVHPQDPDVFGVLDEIKRLGIRGIKLHPDYQNFQADDPAFFPFYEYIGQLGLITTIHVGDDIGMPLPPHCSPKALSNILPLFGGAPVVAAHLGGYSAWADVETYLVGKDIYFDTALCSGTVPMYRAIDIVRAHGADRILFGTDMPWHSPEQERIFVAHLGLNEDEQEKIFSGNARHLLGMS
ncbi:MAG: amidohydrolase family protein [Christensenellales bacterium]